MSRRGRTFWLMGVALLCMAPPAPRQPAPRRSAPPIEFPAAPRLELPVALLIDEAFREKWAVFRLAEKSERLVRLLFDPVTVIASVVERTDQAGVLRPRYVDVGFAAPIAEARMREGALVVEWTFSDPSGCVVWIDTFVGRGEAGWQEAQGKAMRLALEDTLRSAHRGMSTSPELAAYARRWRSEQADGGFVGPPAPDACALVTAVVEIPK